MLRNCPSSFLGSPHIYIGSMELSALKEEVFPSVWMSMQMKVHVPWQASSFYWWGTYGYIRTIWLGYRVSSKQMGEAGGMHGHCQLVEFWTTYELQSLEWSLSGDCPMHITHVYKFLDYKNRCMAALLQTIYIYIVVILLQEACTYDSTKIRFLSDICLLSTPADKACIIPWKRLIHSRN